MILSDLLQRYARQSSQLREGSMPPAETHSVERKGEISHEAIDHPGPASVANGESLQQCSLLWEAPFRGEASQSVAVKIWSDVLQESVWVVRDNLPRTEWPEDGPIYTHREMRMLTKVGQDVLQWVNPVKEIFNAKVVAAHVTTKKLTCKQEVVINALLTIPTIADVADTPGISEATLWHWFTGEDFQTAHR
jgi:hypothetical protein